MFKADQKVRTGQDPKDVTRDIARDLSALVKEINAFRADANHWLTSPEYTALRHRLESAHAAAETALVEARRRVRLNEERKAAIRSRLQHIIEEEERLAVEDGSVTTQELAA